VCRFEQVSFTPEPAAAGLARGWVTELLATWDLSAAADDLRLVVSELVSNAVLHARTIIDVTLSIAHGVLELSVSDRDSRAPRPRRPNDASTSGRGLMLVDALSDDWGTAERMGGKEVWFRVGAPTGWRYADRCVCSNRLDDNTVRRTASGHRVVLMDPEALPGAD
jgi:anti-sigma regulatory factor (Ser/Thr protein kinase)